MGNLAMFNKILVAVDGSAHAINALRCAAELASNAPDATITLLAVDGCRPLKGPLAELANAEDLSREEIFERILESSIIKSGIPDALNLEQKIRIGHPADEILAEAEKSGVDVIVVGRRGIGSFSELLLGSISRKVLHLAKVPVMVVHARDEND